jgi:diguanylate cyclase (GGDEF)-like protein
MLRRLFQQSARFSRDSLEPLLHLPAAARALWVGVVLLSICLVPACLGVDQPSVPLPILLLAPLLNAGVVVATRTRFRQPTFMVSFDYGGITTVALLAAFGPAAALYAFVGEKIAGALTPDISGKRPHWVKSVYNLAWGSPCIAFSWAMGNLAPDHTLEPAVIALAWWLSNGVLVGGMVALAGRMSPLHGLRLAVTQEGWLRLQEGAVSVLAVLAWKTNPFLLVVVVLLVIGQSMTGRRLFREYGRAAEAHEQAQAERRRAEIEAEQARLDPLTRLANRRAYHEAVEQRASAHAALVLDLDHFKWVNDTFGHDVGDRVLIEVAATLRRILEPIALCSRLGGEEFCGLLTREIDDDALFGIAEELRLAISELRFEGYPALRPTVSIGLARRCPHEPTIREAVTRADQALYAAKRDGRNRTVLDTRTPNSLPLAS